MAAENTPPPSSAATANPFGLSAPISIGTSIGRCAPKPGGWSIQIFAPSHSSRFAGEKSLQAA